MAPNPNTLLQEIQMYLSSFLGLPQVDLTFLLPLSNMNQSK